MKCIGLESEIDNFLKHEKLTLPTSYNILLSHLKDYTLIKKYFSDNQSYLRSFIFPKRKSEEIVNRYINLEKIYNYKIKHRGKVPKQTCFLQLLSFSCLRNNSMYNLKDDGGNFDYEINIGEIEKTVNHIIYYFQILFFPESNIPCQEYHLPNKSIQIIKKQGSTHSVAVTPRSFTKFKNNCSYSSRLKLDCGKCSRVFESYRINNDCSTSFTVNNTNESKSPIKSTGISLISNDFVYNFHKKSLLACNSILPEEKIARMNIQSEAYVLSPQSPKSLKSQ